MIHFGDIKKIDVKNVPIVDCIIGGSPCTNLSVASYERAGLAGEESGLFMEQIHIVKELRERDRKENKRYGEDCRPRYMVWENVEGALTSPGRGNKGKDFRVVLTEIIRIAVPGCPDVPMPKNGEWTKSGCLYDEMGKWSVAWRVHDSQFWGTAQRRRRLSLVADFGGMSAPEILFERDLSQGNYEQSGTKGKGTSLCIRSNDESANRERRTEPYLIEMTSTKNTIVDDGICPTLTARMGTGGNQVNAVCIGNGQLNQMSMSEKANTLDTMHDQQAIMVNNIIRRLTPVECERLNGLPDNWTNIGEWTDSHGRKRQSADSLRYKALGNTIAVGYTNNARGFWMWLVKRISAQYERNATMASLFDGIAAFPLAWEYYNGKGSAVWASEIDEFAIAVSKYHFPESEEIKLG